jgi:hypothetical protein
LKGKEIELDPLWSPFSDQCTNMNLIAVASYINPGDISDYETGKMIGN